MTGENGRKRGRKLRDDVDHEIQSMRSRTLRGLRYLRDSSFQRETNPSDNDDACLDVERIVSGVMSREIQLLKQRELQEIRETVSQLPPDEPTSAVFGSPVAVRTMLCQLSIAACVENSFRQIFHATRTAEANHNNCVSLTPECHILLSKACEQMIIDISTRACLDSDISRGSSRITSANILRSLPVLSGRWNENPLVGNFSFAQDVIDRSLEVSTHPLDVITKLHR
jgi:hypothetical protein